jgi:hypothetical protein
MGYQPARSARIDTCPVSKSSFAMHQRRKRPGRPATRSGSRPDCLALTDLLTCSIGPVTWGPVQLLHRSLDVVPTTVHRLHVQPSSSDLLIKDGDDDDASHGEGGAIRVSPVPVELAPLDVAIAAGGKHLGAKVRNPAKAEVQFSNACARPLKARPG